MANQGSSLGWQPNAGGGGGGAEPFDKVYAKVRRWRVDYLLTLPAGALVIDIYNSGLNDADLEIDGVEADILKPGMRFNFVAQQNPADQTLEVSKEITVTPDNEFIEVFVMYPNSSIFDVNSL